MKVGLLVRNFTPSFTFCWLVSGVDKSLIQLNPCYFSTNMEESRGSALENCWEWCYTRCFGYGQHDFQTDSSRSERLASGCEHCCRRISSCLCCLPCFDFICDRCLRHHICYKCLHCSCFYSEDKEDLPDCDTTPGMVLSKKPGQICESLCGVQFQYSGTTSG